MRKYLRIYTFFCFTILFLNINCTTKKENSATVNTKPTVSNKAPDPGIEVKDDFTQLTKADEEREDKSHLDISYFPSNYALEKALKANVDLKIRIAYSRPHKGTRTQIFGSDTSLLVPYGKLWRLGANETTEIEFIKPVSIEGKKINPGRYSVYAIPNKNDWTIILNNQLYTFGAFNYDESKDVVRAKAAVVASRFNLETFLIYFQKSNTGCNMILSWDNIVANLPITIL
jgi:hypothetical protein